MSPWQCGKLRSDRLQNNHIYLSNTSSQEDCISIVTWLTMHFNVTMLGQNMIILQLSQHKHNVVTA